MILEDCCQDKRVCDVSRDKTFDNAVTTVSHCFKCDQEFFSMSVSVAQVTRLNQRILTTLFTTPNKRTIYLVSI